nr:hypothetical protein GCM10025732_07810 [Glycomyces mayteni]
MKPVRQTSDRNTQGVKLIDLPEEVSLLAITRSAEEPEPDEGQDE